MMTHSYTNRHSELLSGEMDFSQMPICLDDTDAVLPFRPFSESLSVLMDHAGYDGPDTPDARARFVLERLQDIGFTVAPRTISDWFGDVKTPDHTQDSREIMLALCFALRLSRSDVDYLFQNVYFDRTLNCCDAREAVCAFCLHNGKSYAHAREMIAQLPTVTAESGDEEEIPYTAAVEREVLSFRDDEELLHYIARNPSRFCLRNHSAREQLTELIDEVKGSDQDAAVFRTQLKRLRQNGSAADDDCKNCGLVVREALREIQLCGDPDLFRNKQVQSIDFMLRMIFGFLPNSPEVPGSFAKNADLKKVIRQNFPSKKLFSDVLNGRNQQYDAVRKVIILLQFYRFYMTGRLTGKKAGWDVFIDETDDLLTRCSLQVLYVGHPYDWIFLYSAHQQDPLDTFRSIIDYAMDPEEA